MTEKIRTQDTAGIRVTDDKLEKTASRYIRGTTTVDEVSRVIRSNAKERADFLVDRAKKKLR